VVVRSPAENSSTPRRTMAISSSARCSLASKCALTSCSATASGGALGRHYARRDTLWDRSTNSRVTIVRRALGGLDVPPGVQFCPETCPQLGKSDPAEARRTRRKLALGSQKALQKQSSSPQVPGSNPGGAYITPGSRSGRRGDVWRRRCSRRGSRLAAVVGFQSGSAGAWWRASFTPRPWRRRPRSGCRAASGLS
jgi:hypothetical protein